MAVPHVPVTNVSGVNQMVGDAWIRPGQTVDVPFVLAQRFHDLPDLSFDWDRTYGHAPSLVDGRLRGLAMATPLSMFDGYGMVGALTAREILRRGIGLDLYGIGWMIRNELDPAILDHLGAPKESWTVGLAKGYPDEVVPALPSRRIVAHTMWESDRIPAKWTPILNRLPLVIVPSAAQIQIFRDSGVTVPIVNVPDPIDVDFWSERPAEPAGPFTIVAWGRLSSRKMPLETVRAFLAAFPRETHPDVRLELKTNGGNFGGGPHQIPAFADDRIVIHDGAWTLPVLREWVARAHLGFFLSRGEGMMNPPMQAMALGVPSIVVDHSGPADYADRRYNFPVALDPATPLVPSPMGDGMRWWNPSLEDAVAQLRAAYDDYDGALRRARAARAMVRRRYTVGAVVDRLLRAVGRVA